MRSREYRLSLTIILLFISPWTNAQKYISEKSFVRIFSSAPLEDIEATNSKGRSVFDAENGEFVFSIPITAFQFKKSLMQEHFNEKYMESDKYPKGIFTGKVTNYAPGESNDNAVATGTLEIHGVRKEIKLQGSLQLSPDRVVITSKFIVRLEDYKIKIPRLLFKNLG